MLQSMQSYIAIMPDQPPILFLVHVLQMRWPQRMETVSYTHLYVYKRQDEAEETEEVSEDTFKEVAE